MLNKKKDFRSAIQTSRSCYSDEKSLFDKSSMAEMLREPLAPHPELSPPQSPRKRRSRPTKTVDSYDSQEGRSVEELKGIIKQVLLRDPQAFEQVRCSRPCSVIPVDYFG